MPDTAIQEFVTSRGVKLGVRAGEGLIEGVKILGHKSRNGRTYPHSTLEAAASLYQDAKVNVNHPAGDPGKSRDYQDRMGQLRNISVREDGLFGDLYYNPKHALAEQLEWDAQNAPENVGLSHNVQARTARHHGEEIVEEITRVQSVDLVADPATTGGLFEQEGLNQEDDIMSVTLESLRADQPDLIRTITEAGVKAFTESEDQKAEKAEWVRKEIEFAEQLTKLTEQVDAYQAAEKLAETKATVDTQITEAKLPEDLLTEVFRSSMYAADEAGRKALIEERITIAKRTTGTQPLSVEQRLGDGETKMDTKSFVEAISG